MSTEPKYLLQPVDRDAIAGDVSQLLVKLNVANGELYRIDNLKQIGRVDPPILVHGSDGRRIKIRSFHPKQEQSRSWIFWGTRPGRMPDQFLVDAAGRLQKSGFTASLAPTASITPATLPAPALPSDAFTHRWRGTAHELWAGSMPFTG